MQKQEIDPNYLCLICTELATEAVETTCCGQLMCDKCCRDLKQKNHENCPMCRVALQVKQSVLARRIISTIKIPCHQCNDKFTHKDLQKHKNKCLKRQLKCKNCPDNIRVQQIVEHMLQNHRNLLIDLCVEYNQKQQSHQKLPKPLLSKLQSSLISSRIFNKKDKQCKLGTTGKYYCGQKCLIGKCKCCDGTCGPTNGQNCDDCMEADVKRFSLQKGYLINVSGAVCKIDQQTKLFSCGRMIAGRQFCTIQERCKECNQISISIALGRYKQLI